MKNFKGIISKLIKEFKVDYYALIDYFVTNKKQFFIEGNYNYNLLIYIKNEINRLKNILNSNQNKNIRYYTKKTKFGLAKFNERKKSEIKNYAQIFKIINNNINYNNKIIVNDNNNSYTIQDKWIKAKGLHCRFSTFFTTFYFIFREYIDSLGEEDEYKDLKELNILILKLVDDYNDNNYFNIIKFLQTK